MISVIIVNWNTRELLAECLQAVYRYLPDELLTETIVVDNGSTDGSGEMICEQFPQVRFIALKENMGFAAANNRGLRMARGKYCLLLNSDAQLTSAALPVMVDFMESHPQAGLLTPALLHSDGSRQNTFSAFPSLKTELFGCNLRFDSTSLKAQPVPSVRGACMLARRQALSEVGNFNERFFLFLEETDLCRRLQQAGSQVWWLPQAKVYHQAGASAAGQSVAARIEYWRSRYLFFRIHYPCWYNWLLKAGLAVKLMIDLLLNFTGSLATMFCVRSFTRKLKQYAALGWWHLRGCPGDWGLGSGNLFCQGEWQVRKDYLRWWEENQKKILSADKELHLYKENPQRRLYEYQDKFYLKFYRRRGAAAKEGQLINRLRQLDIPTVEVIAVGRDWLITKKLAGVRSLHEYIINEQNKLTLSMKISLVRALADLIARLHEKGVYHGDLHAGNILLAQDEESCRLYITDFHRASLKAELSYQQRINNLVQFNMFFSLWAKRTIRLLFLRNYLSRTGLLGEKKFFAREIEKRTRQACQCLWRKRDRLYLKKKKYTRRGKFNQLRYLLNPAYPGLDLADLFSQPGKELKNARSSYIDRRTLPGVGEVVFKVSRQKHWRRYLKDSWRRSRAYRAWQASWALQTRGIRTPRPVVALERRKGPLLIESIFVSKYIPESENLTLWINHNWPKISLGQKKIFLSRLVQYLHQLHERGVFPRDLKASNLLVQGNGGEEKIYLIDLDHLSCYPVIYLRRRLYNLRQLEKSFPETLLVSATMRWRFLRNYFPRENRDNLKKMVSLIVKA